MRIAFTQLVERAGNDDSGQTPQHHDRQNATQRYALIHMQDGCITDGKWNRSFTDATGHNRQDQEEENLERFHAQRQTNAHPDQHADHFATQHREENTHETLDQHFAIHAHDAAHDDATNVEIQNVGAFIELGGGFHHDIRQQAVIDQCGRNERGANRCRAHLADERKTFAEFAAGESKECQRGDHDHDVARQFAVETIYCDKQPRHGKQRQRNNADFPGVENVPPFFF
ncbi:hypothetical protein SRABI106_03747 [Rahnella aquatilis]|nr:hypothetical protein SRABI106_03747 [Rahnella aquatilis]